MAVSSVEVLFVENKPTHEGPHFFINKSSAWRLKSPFEVR
jgi:hypothetical protein